MSKACLSKATSNSQYKEQLRPLAHVDPRGPQARGPWQLSVRTRSASASFSCSRFTGNPGWGILVGDEFLVRPGGWKVLTNKRRNVIRQGGGKENVLPWLGSALQRHFRV